MKKIIAATTLVCALALATAACTTANYDPAAHSDSARGGNPTGNDQGPGGKARD